MRQRVGGGRRNPGVLRLGQVSLAFGCVALGGAQAGITPQAGGRVGRSYHRGACGADGGVVARRPGGVCFGKGIHERIPFLGPSRLGRLCDAD